MQSLAEEGASLGLRLLACKMEIMYAAPLQGGKENQLENKRQGLARGLLGNADNSQ